MKRKRTHEAGGEAESTGPPPTEGQTQASKCTTLAGAGKKRFFPSDCSTKPTAAIRPQSSGSAKSPPGCRINQREPHGANKAQDHGFFKIILMVRDWMLSL